MTVLIRFWVSNYRCFGNKVGLDFTDKKNYRFGEECVRGDFLVNVVVLGNNGSGKTSFGYAISDIIGTLTGFEKDIGQMDESCFLNGSGDSDRAIFHYEFSHRGSIIEYEYSKTTPSRLSSERLLVDRHIIFDYDLSRPGVATFRLDVIGTSGVDTSGLDGSEALLRRICRCACLDRYSPAKVVMDFASHSIYYRAMWKLDEHIGIADEDDNLVRYVVDNGISEELSAFLRDSCDIHLDLQVSGGTLMVREGTKDLLFFSAVSRGTALLCRLYCWNRRSSDRDALMFFDDFDDLFDHRTAENVMAHIIRNSRAQCVFVTHNLALISSSHLRPDCCFVMSDGKLRSLASLTDKSIRRGHNLEKMFREGEFDASD